MGVGVCRPPFTNPSKPADIRIKDDTGEPLVSDHYSFCVLCSPEEAVLPEHETLNIGEGAKMFIQEVRLVTWANAIHLD